jgi:hypothetical protein
MGQQSVRQAARRSALDAQAVLRKERADRERRLEALAVAVLTALGERDALVRDAEWRAGQALRRMTNDEGIAQYSGQDISRGSKPANMTTAISAVPPCKHWSRHASWSRSTPMVTS